MKAKPITVVLGIFVFVVAIGVAILLGPERYMFINVPTAVFVILVAGGLGLASYRGGGLLGYIEACKKHFISAGILGTIIGTIQVLTIVADPSGVGIGIAVALLSVFYGVVLYCISDALVAGVRKQGRG